jgi:hypothetical protein
LAQNFIRVFIVSQAKADLSAAGQFNIQLRKQFSIQQRAMLYPVATVDAIASAQSV